MIEELIQKEDITFANAYAPNRGAYWYIRQMLKIITGEIDNNTIIVEDITTPVSSNEEIMQTEKR